MCISVFYDIEFSELVKFLLQRPAASYQSCLDWAPVSSFVPRTIVDYAPRYLLT